MQSFKYLCIDEQGQRRQGSLRSSDTSRAKEELRDRGWTVLTLGEQSVVESSGSDRAGLSSSEKIRLLLKLSILMKSGVPIVAALEASAKDESARANRKILDVATSLTEGLTLSKALKHHCLGFDESALALIHLGEQSGRLVKILAELSQHTRLQADRMAELKSRLTHPLLQLGVLAVLCFFLGSFFGPRLATMVEGLGGEQPALTRAVGHLFSPFVLGTMTLIFTLTGLVLWLTWSTPVGRELRSSFVAKVPYVKGLLSDTLLARFCHSLALLLDSGFDWSRSLKLARVGDKEFDQETDLFRQRLMDGGFEVALEQNTNFPKLLRSLLVVGYEVQRIPPFLSLYADMLESNIRRRIETLLVVLEPLVLLVLGGMVGLVVVASFLPIMSLVKQL